MALPVLLPPRAAGVGAPFQAQRSLLQRPHLLHQEAGVPQIFEEFPLPPLVSPVALVPATSCTCCRPRLALTVRLFATSPLGIGTGFLLPNQHEVCKPTGRAFLNLCPKKLPRRATLLSNGTASVLSSHGAICHAFFPGTCPFAPGQFISGICKRAAGKGSRFIKDFCFGQIIRVNSGTKKNQPPHIPSAGLSRTCAEEGFIRDSIRGLSPPPPPDLSIYATKK